MQLIERKCTDDPGLNTTVWDPIKTAVLEGTRMQADRWHVDLIYSAFIFALMGRINIQSDFCYILPPFLNICHFGQQN